MVSQPRFPLSLDDITFGNGDRGFEVDGDVFLRKETTLIGELISNFIPLDVAVARDPLEMQTGIGEVGDLN